MRGDPDEILRFWFGELTGEGDYPAEKAYLWFKGGESFDREIAARFGPLHEQAAAGSLAAWTQTPRGRLALIIVLDQFSRNLWRGSPRAFAQDAEALRLALGAIDAGEDRLLYPVERGVFYMPLMHCEDPAIQERSIACYERLVAEAPPAIKMAFDVSLDFAQQHKQIIDRFGRYPHRNEALGRSSTPEELAFLQEPGSSF